jgi:hypothetical protein
MVEKAPTKTNADPSPHNARETRNIPALSSPGTNSGCRPRTYPKGARPWTVKPAIIGRRAPMASMTPPAGVFATNRVKAFAERMTPTRNGEMPSNGPRFGKVG